MTKRARAKIERRASPEDPRVPISAAHFLEFMGIERGNLPAVSIESALTVPAFACGVAFLSRTLAALPLHAYRDTDDGAKKVTGKLATVLDHPNDGMSSFKFRQYFWQQVFTGGRGLGWIERNGNQVENIWPFNPAKTEIVRKGFRLVYKHDKQEYDAADVIDVPFMLRADQTGHHGPVNLAKKALQLALAMGDYAANFFAGGGVPPLALVGPMATGSDALKRQQADIDAAIGAAKKEGKPIFPIPPGYKLEQVGFDPGKGQMTEARRFQVEEIARALQLPPVFLQDLTQASFSNAEQQDLHLVKHLISQWAAALEGEMNLKLFGRQARGRYVKHNLNGLMRGDFKTRIEGLARAVQGGLLTPNEGRELEERPRHDNPAADDLFMQGATVPLGTTPAPAPQLGHNGGPPLDDDSNADNGEDGDEPGTSSDQQEA